MRWSFFGDECCRVRKRAIMEAMASREDLTGTVSKILLALLRMAVAC